MFNRGLRRLASSPSAVHAAALAAAVLPSWIERAVRFAGDVPRVPNLSAVSESADGSGKSRAAGAEAEFGGISSRHM